MTFQPPAQQNSMPPILPNSTGYPRPPQPITTNGTTQNNQSAMMFQQPQPVPSFAPAFNSTNQTQWTQPSIPGQGSAFSPIIQPNISSNQQQYSGGLPRNPPHFQNAGRPPSTPITSPTSSGKYLFVI